MHSLVEVQGALRPYEPLRHLYDEEQFRHLYRSLSGDCRAGIPDEDVYLTAAGGDVRHPDGSGLHAFAAYL